MPQNAGLLPHRPSTDAPDGETRVVRLGTDEAADLCRSLASETATGILDHLSEEPTTASNVADRVDTSLQNAHYHIERLQEAGLIRVVDTWYSSRGVEMNVYAAVYDEFVVVPSTAEASEKRDTAEAVTERGVTGNADATDDGGRETEPSPLLTRP